MKKNKTLILTTLLCLLPLLFSLCVYDRLPEQMAIHWDGNGNPNGYADRFTAAILLPVLMAVTNAVIHIILDHDPKKQNASPALIALGKWTVPALTLILVPITLLWSMDQQFPIDKIVPLLVGIIFIGCGNYMPKCKQNYTVGIKLPWTLHSTENWNRTHHLAGYLWILGGILMLLGCFLPLGNIILLINSDHCICTLHLFFLSLHTGHLITLNCHESDAETAFSASDSFFPLFFLYYF